MSEAQPESYHCFSWDFWFFLWGEPWTWGQKTYQNNPSTFTAKISITCFIVTGGLECGFGPFWFFNKFCFWGGLEVSFKRVISGWLTFIPFGKHLSKSPNKEIQHPDKVFGITKGSLGFCHPHIKTISRYHLSMESGLEKDIKHVLILFNWNHWKKTQALAQTTYHLKTQFLWILFWDHRVPQRRSSRLIHWDRAMKANMESWLLFHDDPPSEKYCICYKEYHTTRYLQHEYLHLVDFWLKNMTIYSTTLEVGTSPNKDDVIWCVLLPKQNIFWCFCSIFVCDKLGFQGALHIYPTFYT